MGSHADKSIFSNSALRYLSLNCFEVHDFSIISMLFFAD